MSTLVSNACIVGAVNGWLPLTISYNTQANAYWSLRASTVSAVACSGLMYAGVPIAMPVPVSPALAARDASIARAMPKSVTTA